MADLAESLADRFLAAWTRLLDDLLELTARYLDTTGPNLRAELMTQTITSFRASRSMATQDSVRLMVLDRIHAGHELEATALLHECRWFRRVMGRVDREEITAAAALVYGQLVLDRVRQFTKATMTPTIDLDPSATLTSLRSIVLCAAKYGLSDGVAESGSEPPT